MSWADDKGSPWTITLYLIAGIGAGIIASLLPKPESQERTEQFFLLLKTPVGQEHVLREAGFRELPGNDTYEMPTILTPRLTIEEARARIDNRAARRQSIAGFVAMTMVVVVLLVGMNILAQWLRP